MSSSDDYHRHRLRTGTKYFKVSVKPFQRLGGVRGGSPEKILGVVWGGSPGNEIKMRSIYLLGVSFRIYILRYGERNKPFHQESERGNIQT